MKLKWYGHASFRVESTSGLSVITDPYDPDLIGFKPFRDTADIVITSSDNDQAHCRADLIPGTPRVINALNVASGGGSMALEAMTITAIEAMEALAHHEHHPDQNGMYRFTVDGVSIGHMGDVGNPLSAEQTAFFAGVDILLALAGGYPTIELPDLKRLIDIARPKLVVPMHFRTLSCKLHNILWIPSFLELFSDHEVDFAHASEVEISAKQLPVSTRALVLDYV